jgi:hypothetical protein
MKCWHLRRKDPIAIENYRETWTTRSSGMIIHDNVLYQG